MGKWILGIAFVALGVAIGSGLAYLRDSDPGKDYEYLFEIAKYATGEKLPAVRDVPKLEVVDGREFEFGSMDVGEKMTHKFTVRNVGTTPLELDLVRTTCKCAVGELTSDKIPPGETGDIFFEWFAKEYQAEYRQTATIQTNDPSNQVLLLSVVGRVTESIIALPQNLVLGDATVDDARKATLTVYAFRDPHLQIGRMEWIGSELSDSFEANWSVASKQRLANASGALSACDVSVQLRPGMPYGSFNETLRLHLSASPNVLDVSVTGRIVSDIAVVGAGYSERRGIAEVGIVKQKVVRKIPLLLLVKGPHRQSVSVEKLDTEPADALDVKVGEPTTYETVVKIPITIFVPPGAPIGAYRSSEDKAGRVVLKTTHPSISEVDFKVSFAVVE